MDDVERFIRHLNSTMANGFTLTPKAMLALGDLLQCRTSVNEERTWGIKPIMNVEELEYHNKRYTHKQIKQEYKVVANAQFFHPKYMVATGLTKEEAEALIKLL